MATHFTAGMGALWAQINGGNSQPLFLGCHQIGDIDQPEGDIELIQCPDPAGVNRFRTVGSIKGAPGAITTSVTTDITDELDHLERVNCPFNLFIHLIKAGRRDVFTNFDRTFVLTNATITNRGLSGLSSRTADDNARSEQTFDLSAEQLLRLVEQSMNRQSISETQAITDITFCNDQQCRTDDQIARAACEVGFAVTEAATGVTANVLYTSNGATWTASAADPFAADEDIIGVECFELSRDSTRVIVARGTTDAGTPLEIAYSDNNGASWTVVEVGAVDGAFAPTRHSLFALDRNNIWVGTDEGYLYKSSDGGLTWVAQQSGGITTAAINAIRFVDENVGWFVGAGNIIARTLDGGDSWSAITGPSAQSAAAATVVEVLDRNRVWVGYGDGDLYYTLDGGVTWSTRSFSGSGVGQVRDIKFLNEALGYMLTNNASPLGVVHWTIDGGYTWASLTTPTNSGLNTIVLCDQWNFYVAGQANSATGFIAKGSA